MGHHDQAQERHQYFNRNTISARLQQLSAGGDKKGDHLLRRLSPLNVLRERSCAVFIQLLRPHSWIEQKPLEPAGHDEIHGGNFVVLNVLDMDAGDMDVLGFKVFIMFLVFREL